eukprot:2228924-Prymnesium_polylepis.1
MSTYFANGVGVVISPLTGAEVSFVTPSDPAAFLAYGIPHVALMYGQQESERFFWPLARLRKQLVWFAPGVLSTAGSASKALSSLEHGCKVEVGFSFLDSEGVQLEVTALQDGSDISGDSILAVIRDLGVAHMDWASFVNQQLVTEESFSAQTPILLPTTDHQAGAAERLHDA